MPQSPAPPRRKRGDWQAARHDRPDLGHTWEIAVAAFLRDARSRNCTAGTIANYEHFLVGPRARQFLMDYAIRDVTEVTAEKLRSFQADLLDAGLSAGTAATFHRVMRNFLGFCSREGWGIEPSALQTKPPKLADEEPETFTPAEEQILLEACTCERDRILFEFMLRTGLRLAEVAALTIDDIVSGGEGAFVRVRQGKGRKDRVVPLDTAKAAFSKRLRTFIAKDRPRSRSQALFLSTVRDATTGDYDALGREGIKSLMRRYSETTMIHVHPHKFRHTFATRALAAGVDSLVLQRALGHSTLAMVNRYVHFQGGDLIRAWQARTD